MRRRRRRRCSLTEEDAGEVLGEAQLELEGALVVSRRPRGRAERLRGAQRELLGLLATVGNSVVARTVSNVGGTARTA